MSRAHASTPKNRFTFNQSGSFHSNSRLSNHKEDVAGTGRDSRASQLNSDYELDEMPRGASIGHRSGMFKRFGNSNSFVLRNNQIALFEDGELWQAVYEGDLKRVMLFAKQDFTEVDETGTVRRLGTRAECERGGEGETILHLAILCMHKDVIRWIVGEFPKLVNEVYLKHRYFGETPLHVAVVTSKVGDDEIVRLLVENGAQVNGPLVTGTEFLKDEDKGVLYYGQTILQFAAATHKNKILKYLVEHAKADLTTVDLYGNNVLHIMAYYGDFDKDVFEWIKTKNDQDIQNGVTNINLMRVRNKDNLTPFQLGIARGHANLIEHIKHVEWEFGFVRCYRVPIDDLDPIQPHAHKDSILIRNSKSAIEIAADRKDKVIITHPLFDSLLQVKWALYARKKFLIRFVLTGLLILIFTITIAFQPYRLEDRRQYFSTPTPGQNSYPIQRLVFEILSVVGVVTMLGFEFEEFFNQGFEYFDGYGSDENAVQWLFSLMVLAIPILRFGVAAAVPMDKWGYIVDTENIVLGLAGILGWIYLLYFSKGFESIGPLVLVFTKIIREDLLQWLWLYLSVTLGFSAALFLQMNDAPTETAGELVPILDWNNYLGSTLWVVRFVFAQSIFDDFRHSKLPGFTEFLFVLYGFMVMVLLVNVLIAKLVETFKDVAKDSKRVWKVQFAHLIVGIDSQMSEKERRFWLSHLGWHDGDSHHKTGPAVAQRFFIFTERDVPDPKDHTKKVTETLKLVVAKNFEGKDIEVRPRGNQWIGWGRELIRSITDRSKEKNAWNDHHLRLNHGKESKFEAVSKRVREQHAKLE